MSLYDTLSGFAQRVGKELKGHSDSIERVESDLDSVKSDVSSNSSLLNSASSDISSLKNDVNIVQSTVSGFYVETSSLKSDLQKNSEDLDSVKQESNSIKSDVLSLDDRIVSVESDVSSASSKADSASESVSSLSSDFSSAKNDIVSLKSTVEDHSGSISSIQEMVSDLGSQVSFSKISDGVIRVSVISGQVEDKTIEYPNRNNTPSNTTTNSNGNGWSVNPLAAEQKRPITYLNYIDDENAIYSGFGDWNANGDRVGIVKHRLNDGGSEVLFVPVASEAVEKIVKCNGYIYAPHVDGNGNYYGSCGYATNEGGTWQNVNLPGQAEHVFDIAQSSEGLWACGSAIWPDQNTVGPCLWFRPNGGEWAVRYREPVKTNTDTMSRYYRIEVSGNSVTVQASAGGTSDGKLRTFTSISESFGPRQIGKWEYNLVNTITVGDLSYYASDNGIIERKAKA